MMWDIVPREQSKNIFYRCVQSNCANLIEISVIKYISLVFVGIVNNLSPILTMCLAYFTVKERFKFADILFIVVSLIGVTLTTIGIKDNKKKAEEFHDKGFENMKIIAVTSMMLVPLFSAWANVTNNLMKGLHR